MIEFLLGGIMGFMIGSSGRQPDHLVKYFTIKTVKGPELLLFDTVENYETIPLLETQGFIYSDKVNGTVMVEKNEGIFTAKIVYNYKSGLLGIPHTETKDTKLTSNIRTVKIGKYSYLEICIVDTDNVVFSDIELLKIIEAVEEGASTKYIQWKKKMEINGIEFKNRSGVNA